MRKQTMIVLLATIAAFITGNASAQTDTTFTYQGELTENGTPATGDYSLEFSLWDAEFGGTPIGSLLRVVPVVDGKFMAELDFGGAAFDNSPRWLEYAVNGVPLSLRTPITRAPYAIQTRGIVVDAQNNVGIGTNFPDSKVTIVSDEARGLDVIATGGDLASVGMESKSLADNGTAIRGIANAGSFAIGVYGQSLQGEAGYFDGDVNVVGTLAKSAGSFKIDHPLDPENKYLSHSFVESPDMKNIYDGNIVTDANGYATVELPEWFDVLNRDFRYQLTVIDDENSDAFIHAKVVQQIQDRRFRIRTSAPRTAVSWQVTGIRQDPYAEAHRIQVEQLKPMELRGLYRHPELYGRTADFREESIKLPVQQLNTSGDRIIKTNSGADQ